MIKQAEMSSLQDVFFFTDVCVYATIQAVLLLRHHHNGILKPPPAHAPVKHFTTIRDEVSLIFNPRAHVKT